MSNKRRKSTLQRSIVRAIGRPIRFRGKASRLIDDELQNAVRIMTLCIACVAANLLILGSNIGGEKDLYSVVVHANDEIVPVVIEYEELEEEKPLVIKTPDITYEDIAEILEEDIEQQIYTIESISFKNNNGEVINTDPVTFDMSSFTLMNEVQPHWDSKYRIDVINTLWDFLVNQQGVAPMNAAAIIGNVYFEGTFGQMQGTFESIEDIEFARSVLGDGNKGYGLAQWTNSTRQKALLDYYHLAHQQFPDDWELTIRVAECCMLYEEIKAYSVFSDIHVDTTLEDACGRVSLKYEAYENSDAEWVVSNGMYNLVSNSGSGYKRLQYTNNIYQHFMNGE